MNPKHALFAESSAELLYRDLILSDVGPGDSKPASGSLQRSLTGRGRSQRRSQSQVNLETNFLLVTSSPPQREAKASPARRCGRHSEDQQADSSQYKRVSRNIQGSVSVV